MQSVYSNRSELLSASTLREVDIDTEGIDPFSYEDERILLVFRRILLLYYSESRTDFLYEKYLLWITREPHKSLHPIHFIWEIS